MTIHVPTMFHRSVASFLLLSAFSSAFAQLPASSATIMCGQPLGKGEGEMQVFLAVENGKFLCTARKGRSWWLQERSGDGALLREVELDLKFKDQALAPLFFLRTASSIGLVAEIHAPGGNVQVTALFPIDPVSLSQGKPELVMDGKPGADMRRFDLRPGADVSPNGKHAVVWRANAYVWYKEPRTYAIATFGGDLQGAQRRNVKHPNGPGDRFEQVSIDDDGSVFVLAIHDKVPGERHLQPKPSGSRSVFELWAYPPGAEEPVKTRLEFSEPIADIAFALTGTNEVLCHGFLEAASGGQAFACALDKGALSKGQFTMTDWHSAPVTVMAPALEDMAASELEMRFGKRLFQSDGSSVVVAQVEHQSSDNNQAVMAYYGLDLLVMRISAQGDVRTVRLPCYQAGRPSGITIPYVKVMANGNVRVLVNDHEANVQRDATAIAWYKPSEDAGILIDWEVATDMAVSRTEVKHAWEKRDSRAVFRAVELTDGGIVLPITAPLVDGIPFAKRVCVLRW